MASVLLTGLPGGGKSTALVELGRRGYRVVDTDESGWCEYRPYAQPVDALHRGEWHWVEHRMSALLESDDGPALFVAGRVANQSTFYDRFDAVVLLSAPIDLLLDRVAARTTNHYGKTALERAEILADLAEIEPQLRASCTHELDASRPVDDVVADLIAIASGGREIEPPLGAPILSDGVVTLRPWSTDDARFMAEAFTDPQIRRYNGVLDADGYPGLPLTIAEAAADIETFASTWRRFATTGRPTGAVFATTDARSGELAGCCGVDDWSTDDVAQIGYWLAPAARGRGFATRAAVLVTRWLFELGAARVFLTVVAGNEPSMAVARRAGFVEASVMPGQGAWMGDRFDVIRFDAKPGEWAPRQMAGR